MMPVNITADVRQPDMNGTKDDEEKMHPNNKLPIKHTDA